MKLTIVRHGQTIANGQKIMQGWIPGELSVQGIRGVETLAQHLDLDSYDVILCSDLHRTKQTYDILRKGKTYPVIYGKEFREIRLGELENALYGSIEFVSALRGDEFLDFQPIGGESIREFKTRVRTMLRSLIRSYATKNVLLVAHGGIVTNIILTALNLDNTYYERYGVSNASVSIVEFTPAAKVLLHNKIFN